MMDDGGGVAAAAAAAAAATTGTAALRPMMDDGGPGEAVQFQSIHTIFRCGGDEEFADGAIAIADVKSSMHFRTGLIDSHAILDYNASA